MSLSLDTLEFLASEQGANLLRQLIHENLSEQNMLKIITRLRRDYTMEQASALIAMATLRQKAVAKFGDDAAHLFFTDAALQQASDPLIRQYRAKNSQNLTVLDVGCGIGADSLAFARAGARVHGIDIDPLRIAIAEYNASVLDLNASFEIADAQIYNSLNDELIFYDPARRDQDGKRIFDVERYLPPLSLAKKWQAKQIMVKLAPSVDLKQLVSYSGLLEFISVAGDLKEAVLHLGTENRGLKATLMVNGHIYHWQREGDEPEIALAEPQSWLIEPDASILRANLVKDLAYTLDATMLDETIAYFCTDKRPVSNWVRAWQIRDWLPFNLKKLRAYLRERKIGKLTVKKRGSAITPESLIQQLKLKGDLSATVVLTRYQELPIVIICDDITNG
jgi:SAM-dependent methyltransferase